MLGRVLAVHFKSENFHYTIQDGKHAGQTIPHVHLHLLPAKETKIGQAEAFGQARTLEDMRDEAILLRRLL